MTAPKEHRFPEGVIGAPCLVCGGRSPEELAGPCGEPPPVPPLPFLFLARQLPGCGLLMPQQLIHISLVDSDPKKGD